MSTEAQVIISNDFIVYVPYIQNVKGVIVKEDADTYYLSANFLRKILGCSLPTLKELVKTTSPTDIKEVFYSNQIIHVINIEFLLLTNILNSYKNILRNVKHIHNYVESIEDFYGYMLTFVKKSEENYKYKTIREKNVTFYNNINAIPQEEHNKDSNLVTYSLNNTNITTNNAKVEEFNITKLNLNANKSVKEEIRTLSDVKAQLYLEINQQEDHLSRINVEDKLYYLESGILYGLQSASNLINNIEVELIRNTLQ